MISTILLHGGNVDLHGRMMPLSLSGWHGADGYADPMESLWTLEMDLEPFNSHFPLMTRPSSIGDGVRFLNRHALTAALPPSPSQQP